MTKEFSYKTERLDEHSSKVSIVSAGQVLSFKDVLENWSAGGPLTDTFTQLIANAPAKALFWELPGLTGERLNDAFECVVIDSLALAGIACNPAPFREYFQGTDNIVVFNNLGADAVLVVPAPDSANAKYAHLAAFCRTASRALCRQFWQRLGETSLNHIGDTPTWISTAGLGVGWLHARLDSYPKYYSHAPYRQLQ